MSHDETWQITPQRFVSASSEGAPRKMEFPARLKGNFSARSRTLQLFSRIIRKRWNRWRIRLKASPQHEKSAQDNAGKKDRHEEAAQKPCHPGQPRGRK